MAESRDVVWSQGAHSRAGRCGAILAHWGYNDSIPEGDATNGKGCKKGGDFFSFGTFRCAWRLDVLRAKEWQARDG